MADLEKIDSSFRIEGDVEIKLLIKQYCSDIEVDLITTYLESPHLSYRDLGCLYGVNHPEKVRRTIESAKRRLREGLTGEIRYLFNEDKSMIFDCMLY